MNVEVFSTWLQRQGHRIVPAAGALWCDQGPRAYESFPYHQLIEPSAEEIRDMLVHVRGVGVRYSTSVEASSGRISYHVVCEGPYTLERLTSNARSKVRRGLKHCYVSPITMDRLANDGWRLLQDTMERQMRPGALDQSQWQRICRAAHDLPGFEAWGAFVDGELASSALVGRIDNVYNMLYLQSHRQYFQLYVNNALVYTISQELLSRPETQMIFYGLHSLDAPSSVDEFKFGMGYRPKPVRQQIMFHPWLAPMFNRVSHEAVRRLQVRYPHSSLVAKSEGMINFYLQGRLPPHEQRWPECLDAEKSELIEHLNRAPQGMWGI